MINADVKRAPPLVAGAQTSNLLRRRKRKRLRSHGHPEKSAKISFNALAHMNDLLDEALKQTFPASDPIAINVEHESPEYENGHNAGFRDPLSSTPKTPWRW